MRRDATRRSLAESPFLSVRAQKNRYLRAYLGHANGDVHVRRMNVARPSLIGATPVECPSQLQGRRTRPCRRHRRNTTNVINGPRTYCGLATGVNNGRRRARQRRRHHFPIVNI